MGFVRLKRRADVKTDETHQVAALPPLERIVEEGLLIAVSAVRMAVKNDIIIGALRDHIDFDPARYAVTARNELNVLARQNEEYAGRVSRRWKALTEARRSVDLSADQRQDVSQFALRRRMYKRVAIALDAAAAADDQVARIVEQAQEAASEEISDAVSARLIRLAVDGREPDYEKRRAARTEILLHVDLALLMSAHAASSGPDVNEY